MPYIEEDKALQEALEERDRRIAFLEGRIDHLESLVQYVKAEGK
jgi:glycerol-3-phosphate responsive antiterminator